MIKHIFHFIMIKPAHYDADGYPIQWLRSAIPSNTLACINGLAHDCRDRQVLGDGVDIRLHTVDETNTRVNPEKIMRMIRRSGGRALIGLVGVQSNQFPRAVDIARPFLAAGLQVCIGGFHVSGCIAMLNEMPPEMIVAQDMGISFFAGEAEDGRLDTVFQDAWKGGLKPLYDHMSDLPSIQGQPTPILAAEHLKRTAGSTSSVDLGRGCPFQCSFCTIINVQGRKSRYRSPDDLEKMIRANYAQGVKRFFITDDNFARNKQWEALFDRLIELREQDGMKLRFVIQVDTLCHKIPNFIEKATRAGATKVFIGLENINPDNLAAAHKGQNRITEYRDMLLKWKQHGAMTYVGYIVGFPNDTPQSLLHDVEILQRELAVDLIEFNILTPLPGSQDHKEMYEAGTWMDPDLNKYDLNHWVMNHPTMSHETFMATYDTLWKNYFSVAHMETIMRRATAQGINAGNLLFLMLWFYLAYRLEAVHPVEGGYFRRKNRKNRRHGMPIENPLVFYPRFWRETVAKHIGILPLLFRLWRVRAAIKKDPDRMAYTDLALTPATQQDVKKLDMFLDTRGAAEAVAKQQRQDAIVAEAKQNAAQQTSPAVDAAK